MAGKLMGLKQAQQNLNRIVDEISSQKIVTALTSASIIITTEAASMTPIDTSTLINSQYRTIDVNGTRVTGRIGYSANYALYVHNASGKLKGQPRANGNGAYWGPNGESKFLDKAVENTRSMVDAAIMREMRR